MTSTGSGAGGTTRERILRVAAQLFAEHGYHGTGVADIGAAAGVKRGALYHHIGSKEDLLFDLSKRHVEEALERGRAVVRSALPPVEKFRALAREHLATVAARRAEVTLVMREMHALTGTRAQQLRDLRDEHRELFAAVLREGVAHGVFRAADPVTVLGILGSYNWTYVWFDADGELSVEELADRITDLFVQGIRVPDDQAAEPGSDTVNSATPLPMSRRPSWSASNSTATCPSAGA